MYLVTETPSQALECATNYVLNQGKEISPRGMKTFEVLNATMEITKPWHIPLMLDNRTLNQNIGAMEALQLVGQISVPELMVNTSKVFSNFLDDGTFHGAYGPRIHGNLRKVVDQLKKDDSSRQAVLTIFNSDKDLNVNVKDVPCTLTLQYFVRDGKLLARTSMRSNDLYLGMPYDFVQFIALQGAIAQALDIPMGTYSHTVGSLHIYEQHMREAEFIKATRITEMPYKPLWSGNTIEEISSDARLILGGGTSSTATRFEQFLGNVHAR
jgi:thymidylate synthase